MGVPTLESVAVYAPPVSRQVESNARVEGSWGGLDSGGCAIVPEVISLLPQACTHSVVMSLIPPPPPEMRSEGGGRGRMVLCSWKNGFRASEVNEGFV